MGIIDIVSSPNVYLDANIFIYALEGYSLFLKSITELFDLIDKRILKAFTSEFTLAETLVKPMADNNLLLQQIYQDTIQTTTSLQVVPVNRKILIEAAQIRSRNTYLKLPDAIHLATARYSKCQTFLTNDKYLKSNTYIKVILMDEI